MSDVWQSHTVTIEQRHSHAPIGADVLNNRTPICIALPPLFTKKALEGIICQDKIKSFPSGPEAPKQRNDQCPLDPVSPSLYPLFVPELLVWGIMVIQSQCST